MVFTLHKAAGLALTGLFVLPAMVLAADVQGSVSVGSGYLDNPLGVDQDEAAGYLTQSLRLFALQGNGADRFRLGYEGAASQFGNDTHLGSQRHGLGWEWFHADAVRTGAGAGLQFSLRRYETQYELFDHQDLNTYITYKVYPSGNLMMRTAAQFQHRRYADLPEESFLEPRLQVELKRFAESRTTVGLDLRAGLKYFYDSAASRVWETPNLPSTSQLAARLNFARGLSERLAFRGWAEARFNLSDFPHYVDVEEGVYDSPLLDVYAHDGFDSFAALKWLAPGQLWLEPGAAYGDHDYGSLLFGTDAGGGTRQDQVLDLFVSLEKPFSGSLGGLRLNMLAGLRSQDSTLAAYTYDGVFAQSALAYHF